MIGILETTHALHDHASGNAAIIQAISLAFPAERMLFAATPTHLGHVQDVRPLSRMIQPMAIAVEPPGGVSARRFLTQWRAMRSVMRRGRPETCVLLSSGPETFFAARAIVTEFASVTLFIVLHGNLNDAIGWRSRDPRRRLFDYRSGLAAARHERIRLVVLEDYIRAEAIKENMLSEATLVWPNAFSERELAEPVGLPADGSPLRIAFLGSASRNKGFHRFIELAREAPAGDFDFRCIGTALEPFPDAAAAGITMPLTHLNRDEYVRRLRGVDYVVTPYDEAIYRFTASGSLLDCIAQAKPVISLDFPGARALAEKHGEIGFIGGSMAELKALFARKTILGDPAAHARFQRNLLAIREQRTPAGIAALVRRDLTKHARAAQTRQPASDVRL